MLGCYCYVLTVILLSDRMSRTQSVSHKTSRKFLHIMIGNLPFAIPFFTSNIFPFLVALPFVFVTFFASPYSPFERAKQKLKGLADLTEEGHHLGLFFYAISYTLLAFFFSSQPYIVAVGILPMAYGDAAASLVGEKFGRRKYKIVAEKSLEGSAAMFLIAAVGLVASMAFFSVVCGFAFHEKILSAVAAAAVATVVEALSPLGFDNLTVPASSVLVFIVCQGVT